MNIAAKFATGLVLGSGLLTVATVSMAAAPTPYFQESEGPAGIRGLIDRTQSDLRAAEDVVDPKNSKDRERYRNAQKNLSDLDRHFTKGKYDRGDLDRSIGDIQSILDHNTLQASSRDALLRDVEDLRVARARFGK